MEAPCPSLLLVHNGKEAILKVAAVQGIICNKWEINPEYRRYSARLTRHKPKIK